MKNLIKSKPVNPGSTNKQLGQKMLGDAHENFKKDGQFEKLHSKNIEINPYESQKKQRSSPNQSIPMGGSSMNNMAPPETPEKDLKQSSSSGEKRQRVQSDESGQVKSNSLKNSGSSQMDSNNILNFDKQIKEAREKMQSKDYNSVQGWDSVKFANQIKNQNSQNNMQQQLPEANLADGWQVI